MVLIDYNVSLMSKKNFVTNLQKNLFKKHGITIISVIETKRADAASSAICFQFCLSGEKPLRNCNKIFQHHCKM